MWVEYPNGLLFLSVLKYFVSLSKQRGTFCSGANLEGLSTHSVYFLRCSSKISFCLFDSVSSVASLNCSPTELVYVQGSWSAKEIQIEWVFRQMAVNKTKVLTEEKLGACFLRRLHSALNPRVQQFRFHYRCLREVWSTDAWISPRLFNVLLGLEMKLFPSFPSGNIWLAILNKRQISNDLNPMQITKTNHISLITKKKWFLQ